MWLNVINEHASQGQNPSGKFSKNTCSIFEVKRPNSKLVVEKWDPISLIGSGWEAQT